MTDSLQGSYSRNQVILICILLTLATLAIYWQALDFSFIDYDDNLYITRNENLNKGFSWKGIIWASTSFHAGLYIPVTWFSFLLNYELHGLAPSGYHLTNIIFHTINTLLLFLVFLRMTGKLWQSSFVAALFALHPLHVESVAWVTERKDMLSCFFFMLTLYSYSWYIKMPNIRRYLLVCLFFALGLLSKPILVTLPFLLLLLDYWPLKRFKAAGNTTEILSRFTRLTLEKAPLFFLTVIVSYITIFAQKHSGDIAVLELHSISDRLANSLIAYVNYLGKTFWPHDLAVLYPYPASFIPWQIAAAFLSLAAISIFTLFNIKKYPYLFVGWCWFLGILVPNIGFIQSGPQAMADRFTYIPLIGIFIMVTWHIAVLSSTWKMQKVILGVCSTAILVFLSTISWQQTGYWRNTHVLFGHTLAVTRNNYTIHNNLGALLLEEGKLTEAQKHLSEAIRIYPQYTKAHYNLGTILIEQGRFPEAADYFSKAISISPDDAPSHNSLAYVLSTMGHFNDAAVYYLEAIRLNPGYIDPYMNLGKDLLLQDNLEEAAELFQKALSIDPEVATAHNNLGLICEKNGDLKAAEIHFIEVLRIDPGYPYIHTSLGVTLARQGKLDAAIEHFKAELQQNPDYVEALSKLAMALQMQGDPSEAKQHMDRALFLGYEMPPEVEELFLELK